MVQDGKRFARLDDGIKQTFKPIKMMNNKQQRYVLFRHFKLNYGIHLKEHHIDDIQEIFHEIRRQSVFNIGMYRAINFTIALMFIIIWFFIPEALMKWFWLTVWIVFAFYNVFHAVVNYIEFKRIKMPNPGSEEDVENKD